MIDGACPLMFEPTADGAHKFMRVLFGLTGRVPRTCPYAIELAAAEATAK